MGRILADAATVAAERQGRRPRGVAGLLAAVWRGLGGAPAAAGLAAATLAGVWIGASPPVLLDGLADSVWGRPAAIDMGGVFGPGAIEGIDTEGAGG